MSRLRSACSSSPPKARRASSTDRPFAIASSMCDSSSSRISRSSRSRRNKLRNRPTQDIEPPSRQLQYTVNRRRHRYPALLLGLELLAAARRQFVNTRAAAVLFGDPLGADPVLFFHPVQRRVQRPFFNAQDFTRYLLN